jgi:hypothetical protein
MQWHATYTDGTTLGQYNGDGVEHSSEQIDRSRLASFALISEAGDKLLQFHLEPGQRLIFRRRIEQSVGGSPQVCYLAGWQQTIHGQNVQSIWYVFEEGARMESAGRFDDKHPWFYPVDMVRSEAEERLADLKKQVALLEEVWERPAENGGDSSNDVTSENATNNPGT